MKKSPLTAILVLSILLLSSCATTVKTTVTRPAELDLHGANSISILPFQVNVYSFSNGFLNDLNEFFRAISTTATEEAQCADYLTKQLTVSLVDSDYLQVISAKAVESAINRNRKIPADVYLTGYIQYFDTHVDTHRIKIEEKDKDGNKLPPRYENKYEKKVKTVIVYDLIEASTNRILASKSYTITDSSGEYRHKSSLPSTMHLISDDLDKLSTIILKQLQPYEITKYLSLLSDKTKTQVMKDADKLAKNGFFNMAQDYYYEFYQETGNFEAGYNAAILMQAQGNLDQAEELMYQLYQTTLDKRAAKALNDIYNEQTYSKELEEQLIDKALKSNDYSNIK